MSEIQTYDGPKYKCISVVEVAAPFDKVSKAVFDMRICERWSPFVEKVDLLQESASGVGNKRICHLYDGGSIEEIISVETETKVVFQVLKKDIPFPMILNYPGCEIEKIDENNTRVTWIMEYVPKWYFKCLASNVMKGMMAEVGHKHAYGIKIFCETDKDVDNKTEMPPVVLSEFKFE